MLALLFACAHLVEVRTAPEGAELRYGGEPVGPAPVTLRVRPFGPRALEANFAGYRTLSTELPLSWTTSRFVGDALLLRPLQGLGIRRSGVLELMLVPEHEGVGTWEEGEVR